MIAVALRRTKVLSDTSYRLQQCNPIPSQSPLMVSSILL
ncbi:hypothetical protein SynROS8604_02241 [Synechococcus sp. ROS8604]|nr:hypothetical protein SynROS8604_02241 [Synechococcus sp. ROS8604]